MKHAGPSALTELADLIAEIRKRDGLKEPKTGTFYRKGRAWLHFHEDAAGFFADLRTGNDWERFRVSDHDERAHFLGVIDAML
jgi:hypothetical protein